MVYLLAVCLFIVWLWLRSRLEELETRIAMLERWDRAPAARPEPVVRAAPPKPVTPAPPAPKPIVYAPIAPRPVVAAPMAAASRDWESVVGGNWLNKLGVVVLVIGIAL